MTNPSNLVITGLDGYFILNFLQKSGFLFLPRKLRFAKVAIGADLVVVHIQKPQTVDDALRSEVIRISDILFDETLVLMLRAEGLDIYADRLRHSFAATFSLV